MKRREFVTLLGGAVASAWPLAAHAQHQPTKIPRVGIIDDAPMWDYFRQGLRGLGYVEGQNIVIEYRAAQSEPDRLLQAATELAGLPVDVLVAFGSTTSRAAQLATTTVPIVMIAIGDPVRAGFVASLARPGGNMTGNTILGPDLSAKRVADSERSSSVRISRGVSVESGQCIECSHPARISGRDAKARYEPYPSACSQYPRV